MFAWLAANAATVIIGAILLFVVALIILSMRKKAKKGQCVSCDCGCSGSEQNCHCGLHPEE